MEIWGCIFIIIVGTLGHFIFEWSGHKKWAGIFFAVNESTWEHIKLSIYPAFLWLIVEIIVRGDHRELVIAQFASMLTTMLLIPGLFYGYTAITKKNWLITDIICFCLSIAAGRWVFTLVLEYVNHSELLYWTSVAGLIAILKMYFEFSYRPPHNFLFKDPISGGFGPTGHDCHSHFHNT